MSILVTSKSRSLSGLYNTARQIITDAMTPVRSASNPAGMA
jgi:hypothetical protein